LVNKGEIMDRDKKERLVLGAIVVQPERMEVCVGHQLTSPCFKSQENRDVYLAMLELYDKGKPIEFSSIMDSLGITDNSLLNKLIDDEDMECDDTEFESRVAWISVMDK
jgi:replicative DNA helicase